MIYIHWTLILSSWTLRSRVIAKHSPGETISAR